MPNKPKKPCAAPGCPALTDQRFCEVHAKAKQRRYDEQRGTAAQRGYGARWRRLRKMVLARQPLCADPFGVHREHGETVPATEVDHIVAKDQGGDDSMDNLQGLCKSCHSEKTWREKHGQLPLVRSTIPVTLVTGPPASGKPTYVRERARWGDLIAAVDSLFVAVSGLKVYEKPQNRLPFVCEARDALIRRLGRESGVRHAWIITSEPDILKLERMKGALGAELVVLEVSPNECIRRISLDERRSDKVELWAELVRDWWRRYRR